MPPGLAQVIAPERAPGTCLLQQIKHLRGSTGVIRAQLERLHHPGKCKQRAVWSRVLRFSNSCR